MTGAEHWTDRKLKLEKKEYSEVKQVSGEQLFRIVRVTILKLVSNLRLKVGTNSPKERDSQFPPLIAPQKVFVLDFDFPMFEELPAIRYFEF